MKQKVFSMLALLLVAATGAWAQSVPTLAEATTADYGKVVCAAGHLHDAKTAVPDGCTAVGILGKVTETGHGLILALQDATAQKWNTINGWTSVDTYAGTTLKVLPDDAARGSLTSYTTLGETAVSNWAVAQKSDYEAIFSNLGSTAGDSDGTTYDGNVNAYIITGVGGTAITGTYWSATERDDLGAWYFSSDYWINDLKTLSVSVRPVLGFGGEAAPAAATGYSVTLKDGTEDATNWTIEPNSDLEGGETVTITYSGEKRVKSVTAVKKAAEAAVPEGAINGKFTVSASGDQVYFSKGNLKYNGSAWSFFDNQYDYLTTHDGTNWDKFGWSTSTTTYGMSTSESSSAYSGDFVDWGATMGTGWRTLTSDEWKYLYNTRSASTVDGTANARYAKAKVNNVQGVILFPDTYTHPSDVTAPTGINETGEDGWYDNTYDATAWAKMESAGCVFLPAAGIRVGSSVNDAGEGDYWSGTANGTSGAYDMYFDSDDLIPASSNTRHYGFSVRLVCAAEAGGGQATK